MHGVQRMVDLAVVLYDFARLATSVSLVFATVKPHGSA